LYGIKESWKEVARKFIARHPTLSLRRQQPTSAAPNKGCTSESVTLLFDIFGIKMKKIEFSPNHLARVDENISQLSNKKPAEL
jgi:hypothetical protein